MNPLIIGIGLLAAGVVVFAMRRGAETAPESTPTPTPVPEPVPVPGPTIQPIPTTQPASLSVISGSLSVR